MKHVSQVIDDFIDSTPFEYLKYQSWWQGIKQSTLTSKQFSMIIVEFIKAENPHLSKLIQVRFGKVCSFTL